MNYEEKYNEILEWARKNKARLNGVPIEEVLPELAESEDERIRKELVAFFKAMQDSPWHEEYWHDLEIGRILAYLEKQKENPKSADSIPSDCVSEAKCEDRWHKVGDSLPDNPREVLCKDEAGNYFIGRYYSGEGWEISNYDDEDKPHHLNPPVSKWIDFPSEKQKEQKPNIEICPHSVKSKSYKENGFPFKGLEVRGLKGPIFDPGDPGRRGRMGGVPKDISKEAEAFQAQFPAPYDKDDIITAYETAKIKAMEDLPKWKEVKNLGNGECFVGTAFEATGRRYPILFCYGYSISIEQLFEKLPKEDKLWR